MNTPTGLLQCEKLRIEIGSKLICQDLDLTMRGGEIWGVLGANGAGKTTLMHSLAGLRPLQGGSVKVAGKDLHSLNSKQRAQHIGVLLQGEDQGFPCSVLQHALLGRHPHLGLWQWESQLDYQLAHQALARVGLADMTQRSVQELSGGERQRLKIATLMLQEPQLWILDEPSNHLDLHHQVTIIEQLCGQIRESSQVALMSLHDLNLAARFCDKLIMLFDDGRAEVGDAQTLLNAERLERLYGHPIDCIETPKGRVFVAA